MGVLAALLLALLAFGSCTVGHERDSVAQEVDGDSAARSVTVQPPATLAR